MKKSFFLILVLTAILGCNSWDPSLSINQVVGPIQLNNGSTSLILDDYFVDGIEIDSIKSDITYISKSTGNILKIIEKPEVVKNQKPISVLSIYSGKSRFDFLLKKSKKESHEFKLNLPQAYDDVRIKGDFNNWNQDELVLSRAETGEWMGNAFLKPGKHQYKIVADGSEIDDSQNPNKMSNGMGGFNSILEISGAKPDEIPSIQTLSHSSESIKIATSITDNIYAFWNNTIIESTRNTDGFDISIPKAAMDLEYSSIRVYGYNDYAESNDLLIPLKNGKVITSTDDLAKDDWRSSIMYFMMIDRFNDGDSSNNFPVKDSSILHKANYWGGDIAGITQKIKDGFFEDLGINTIWVSPLSQNPLDAWGQFKDPDTKFSGYHGYWPISSTSVDYRFGNSESIHEMLEEAHARGMKVLLDYVANHVHQQHPVYQEHPDWVTPLYLPDGTMNTEKWDEHRLTTWFDTFMPSLNFMDQQVTDFMVDSALFWIQEYDFDGFRHDATKHIPENFWRTLTKKVKLVSKERGQHIYQIGETYGSYDLVNSYVSSGMLDAQFDFNMYDNALPVFAKDDESFERLVDAINSTLATYGHHHLMGNITGNQDKPRFVSYADGSISFETPWMEVKRIGWKETIPLKDPIGYDKMAMFNAFNMTIPGIPIIYYGDEIGMPGAGDPDNRRMMVFDNLTDGQSSLRTQVSSLIKMRNQSMALIYGDFVILEHTDKLLKYSRSYFSEKVTVTLNKENWEFEVSNQVY